MISWILSELPIDLDFESKRILKSLPKAHAALAELKGIASTIPNQNILINSIALQEAKDSSEIENIITTHDELYRAELNLTKSIQSKEVQSYISALKIGYREVLGDGLLKNSTILKIQEELEKNNAGYRKVPGTVLRNSQTGEVVYEPPQDNKDIVKFMQNLERFINDNSLSSLDPLVKMAIIHFQFESIHPFYDGNGRTGRIINILYLISQNLLRDPILFLSSYMIRNKGLYYKLLQEIRSDSKWEDWIIYMIDAVETISLETIDLVQEIKNQMLITKQELRSTYKFYSQDLLNNLFKHPYTKIDFIVKDLSVSRLTAANYLNKLAKDGVLRKEKIGKSNYYINEKLYEILVKRN
ncbi:Fic family protein [Saprospiraceae bacterium]|nr:Fic family protein [Saprospiraceae bacterium]